MVPLKELIMYIICNYSAYRLCAEPYNVYFIYTGRQLYCHPEPVRRPGNKSSRHMKADSVVSCDCSGSEGVWYLDSLMIHREAQLPSCLRATQTDIKKELRHADADYPTSCGSLLSTGAFREPWGWKRRSWEGKIETKALIKGKSVKER